MRATPWFGFDGKNRKFFNVLPNKKGKTPWPRYRVVRKTINEIPGWVPVSFLSNASAGTNA